MTTPQGTTRCRSPCGSGSCPSADGGTLARAVGLRDRARPPGDGPRPPQEEEQVSTTAAVREDLRRIPLSSIVVEDGFNPRGNVADDADFRELVATVKQRGVLQPIRVRRRGDEHVLIAGE